MTEIDISTVLIEGDTATIMGEKYKRVEEPKSPAEEAYKEVYGWYPPTDPSVSNFEENRWESFQIGYKAAKEDCKVGEFQPTPQEPEENMWKTVALLFGRKLPVILPYSYDELSPDAWFRWVVFTYDDYISQRDIESGYHPAPWTREQTEKSLREAFKKVQQTEEWKETQRKIDSNYDEMVKNPPEFLKFELGKTLEELICKCIVDYNSTIPVGLLEDILNNIEKWLPDFQSSSGSQSFDTTLLVEGWNNCISVIKGKLR